MKKLNRKKTIPLFAVFIVMAFTGGYFAGRFTSTNWNSESTAFLYMCRATRITDGGRSLELQMPDMIYRFDGKDLSYKPNDKYIAQASYPIVGGQEFDHWMDEVVLAGGGLGTKVLWDAFQEGESSNLQKILSRERFVITLLSAGSFTGGYFVGHRFKEDFEAPIFRKTLNDKAEWQKVWQYQQNMLQTNRNLSQAKKNIDVAVDPGKPEDTEITKKREEILALQNKLYKLVPEIRRISKDDSSSNIPPN